jgi:type III secretion protein J
MYTQNYLRVLPKGFYYLFILFMCSLLMTSCESRKTIVNGVDEREANEILVFLASRNIEAIKVKSTEGGGGGAQKAQTWDISVHADDAREAMAILSQHGLPRLKAGSLLGIFTDVGLVPSEMAEKIRYQAGLSEQIASVIRKIDGVLDASVQISYPEEDPLNPGKKKGEITAAIYVKHNGVLDDPNSQLVTKIKRLVAGSVTGLDIDNVTLIADRTRFGEMPTGAIGEDQKSYVDIWTIVLAKESVSRFRVIFFSFIFINVVLLVSLVWICWKIYPFLKRHGGVSTLFHLQALELGTDAEPVKEEEEKEEMAEESEEEDEDEDDEEEDEHTDKTKDVT